MNYSIILYFLSPSKTVNSQYIRDELRIAAEAGEADATNIEKVNEANKRREDLMKHYDMFGKKC